MRIIVVASRKGGSGKTTLAGHLAVQAERSGAGSVAVLDTDPQGSLADWWNARAASTPHFLQSSMEDLEENVDWLRDNGVETLIIDTPPALSHGVTEVIGLSDLVIVPTRPSPHDLRAVGITVKLVEHLGKPLIFVINSAPPRARITNEAITLLSLHGPLAPSIIHHRVDFASSMIDGRTVMELPGNSRSREEIEALWDYLDDRLSGGGVRPDIPAPPQLGQELASLPAAGAGGA